MAARFRLVSILAGLALAAVATAAAARDYVVVSSTDPAMARGQVFAAGARIPLPAGQTLTLMHATGDLLRLKGAAGGVTLPRRDASQGDADRLAILKVIVAPAGRQAAGGVALRKTRSGVCPPTEQIRTLDDIVLVQKSGCVAVAAEALEAWIAAHPPAEEAAP
jgi:hypothetical protein